MKRIVIENKSKALISTLVVEECSSFPKRFMGLMLRKNLLASEGVLIVGRYQSRIQTTIHSLFMFFEAAAVWIDNSYKVVDVRIIKPWKLAVMPARSALYVLEIHASRCAEFTPGDQLGLSNG